LIENPIKGAIRMKIRRTVPNLKSDKLAESKAFYTGVLGFEIGMDMGWIVTLGSPDNPTAQISLLSHDATAPVVPNVSIEVADVDNVHAAAVQHGAKIVYPLTDEPWGVRRFFVADPNGVILNVMTHLLGN
jgi:catechol 2,3-dioxygenase-like lactoylglutathione lyase family enzyme